jgi:hypothetical protein
LRQAAPATCRPQEHWDPVRSSFTELAEESEPQQQCGLLSSLTLTLEGLLDQLGRAVCAALIPLVVLD